MTRARDHKNWISVRCEIRSNPRFLRLADHLGIADDDPDAQDLMVGRLHRLWSRVWSDGIKRFDTLRDIERMSGVPRSFLEGMVSKEVGWIRRVKPTEAEMADRMDRGYTEEEASQKWFEVRLWNVQAGSGERETDRKKQGRKGQGDHHAQDGTTTGGLAEETTSRPTPSSKITPSRQAAAIQQIRELQAQEQQQGATV